MASFFDLLEENPWHLALVYLSCSSVLDRESPAEEVPENDRRDRGYAHWFRSPQRSGRLYEKLLGGAEVD